MPYDITPPHKTGYESAVKYAGGTTTRSRPIGADYEKNDAILPFPGIVRGRQCAAAWHKSQA